MFGLIINILKTIVSIILKVYKPSWLLRLDKWCEEKLGIDLIKQEKKFHEKYPGIMNRIDQLEKHSHPPIAIQEFDGYKELIKRIEKIERK